MLAKIFLELFVHHKTGCMNNFTNIKQNISLVILILKNGSTVFTWEYFFYLKLQISNDFTHL